MSAMWRNREEKIVLKLEKIKEEEEEEKIGR